MICFNLTIQCSQAYNNHHQRLTRIIGKWYIDIKNRIFRDFPMIQKLNHKKKKNGEICFFGSNFWLIFFLSQTSKKWVKSFKFLGVFRNFFVFYEEKLGKLPPWVKKHEYQNYFRGFFLNVNKNMIWIHFDWKKKDYWPKIFIISSLMES